MNTTSMCRHRRQLALARLQALLLLAAWAWIGVVAYQRWGNNAVDLTEPDQLGFTVAAVVIYLVSFRAARLLSERGEDLLIQRRTCMHCRHHS